MKKYEISVIIKGSSWRYSVEAEDKKEAIKKTAAEVYRRYGHETKVDGYVVNEVV
jgi:hypothetical protein